MYPGFITEAFVKEMLKKKKNLIIMQYFLGLRPLGFWSWAIQSTKRQKKATTEHVHFLFILYVW